MTLKVRVSRVDDYSEELTKSLEKLEAERARGALDRAEQEDFLHDLRRAMTLRDLRPMRMRARIDLALAVLVAVAAGVLHRDLPLRHVPFLVLLALCAVSLGMALWRYRIFLRRQHHDLDWLDQIQAKVAAGGTIFD